MPFLSSALGLTAMCSLGWGNLVAFDWNDLPVGREFDCKFLKKVKSPPYALPPPPRRHYIDRCITLLTKFFWQILTGGYLELPVSGVVQNSQKTRFYEITSLWCFLGTSEQITPSK